MNYLYGAKYRVSNSVLVGIEYLCVFVGLAIWFVHNEIQPVPSLLDVASIAFMAALVSGTAFYIRFMRAGPKSFIAFSMGVLAPLTILLITAGANIWYCQSVLSASLDKCS